VVLRTVNAGWVDCVLWRMTLLYIGISAKAS
jgi:hypothetical protein